MQFARFESPRLPTFIVIYTVPGWPPRAWAAGGAAILFVAEAPSRGATLLRCRRALRTIGIL